MLQDIWILSEDGVVLFTHVFDEVLDTQLLGALMSAINSFVKELSGEYLKSFKMKDTRYTFLKDKNFLFITASSKKFKEKKIFQELAYIKEKFFELFPESFFQNWDQDVSCFECLKNEIKDILEDPVKDFWNGF